jgi:hypothetical protein
MRLVAAPTHITSDEDIKEKSWVPALAGTTDMDILSCHTLKSSAVRPPILFCHARAGGHPALLLPSAGDSLKGKRWVPAFAGTTELSVVMPVTGSADGNVGLLSAARRLI